MLIKTVALVALLCVALCAARPKWNELEGYTFAKYVKHFRKHYDAAEYKRRERIFTEKLAEVQLHNADLTQSWKKGINHMSDWTSQEFLRLNGLKFQPRDDVQWGPHGGHVYKPSGNPLPYSVDYRTAYPAILTGVKDQGKCGSCWAHASTEAIETYWAIRHRDLYVLSQQQINSCTPNVRQCGGSGGCGGNIPEHAYEYIIGAGGIAEEWVYPYTSYWGNSGVCNASTNLTIVSINNFTRIASNNADDVLDAVANVGPLTVSVDASQWQDYERGVFTGCNYAKNISQDHSVQLIGYGTDEDTGMLYWLIRNSWSAGWGDHGFIRLERTKDHTCGWNVQNQNGEGCEGGPSAVWSCGMCGVAYDASFVNVN